MIKKAPPISPLLLENNFISDIKTKADIFNKFFVQQCTPLKMTVYFQLTLIQVEILGVRFEWRVKFHLRLYKFRQNYARNLKFGP